MRTTEKFQPWLTELIEAHQGIYATPNDVELILDVTDETFYLGCKWPTVKAQESPAIELEINKEFADHFEFADIFPIEHLTDLDHLTPEGLFKLYGTGQMWINSTLDERGCFWDINFRIKNGITYIRNSETDKAIPYSGLLSTQEEIILFTRKYMRSHPPKLDPRMADKIRGRGYSP